MTKPSIGLLRPVADRIWVATCQPASVNVGVIVGSQGCVVVDPGPHPDLGAQLRSAIAEVTDVAVRAVVLTHDHWDHWPGAAAFEGVDLIAHDNFDAEDALSSAADILAGMNSPLDELRETAGRVRRIGMAAAVPLGDRVVEVVHLGSAHTAGDLVVTVSDGAALFTGDLVEQSAPPSPDPRGRVQEWPAVLDRLSGMLSPHTVVVPGHGDPVDKTFVFQQRNELVLVNTLCEQRCRDGQSIDAALAQGGWPWEGAEVEALARQAYAELAEAGVRPGLTLGLTERQ